MKSNIKVYETKSFLRHFNKLKKQNPNLDQDYFKALQEVRHNPRNAEDYLGKNLFKKSIANSSKNQGRKTGLRFFYYFYDETNQAIVPLNIFEKDKIAKLNEENLTTTLKNHIPLLKKILDDHFSMPKDQQKDNPLQS